jgi:hypothetical protein
MSVVQREVSKLAPESNSSRKVRTYCEASWPVGATVLLVDVPAGVTAVEVLPANATTTSEDAVPVESATGVLALDALGIVATGSEIESNGVVGTAEAAAAATAAALGTAMGATAVSVIVPALAISVLADAAALLAAGARPLAASVVVEAAGLELEPPPQAASVRQKSRGDMLVVRIGMMDFRSG